MNGHNIGAAILSAMFLGLGQLIQLRILKFIGLWLMTFVDIILMIGFFTAGKVGEFLIFSALLIVLYVYNIYDAYHFKK